MSFNVQSAFTEKDLLKVEILMSFNIPRGCRRQYLLKVEILMSFNPRRQSAVHRSTESRNFNEF